jgi:hypothetical protein
VNEVKASIKFQLKKVLCMGIAVANVEMSEAEIRTNVVYAINFLVRETHPTSLFFSAAPSQHHHQPLSPSSSPLGLLVAHL